MELKYNSLGAGTGQAFRLQGQAVHTQLQKLALSVKWKSDPLREAFKKNYEGSEIGPIGGGVITQISLLKNQ